MKSRIVLFLSTHGADPRRDALPSANDDWDPDCPAAAAHALRPACRLALVDDGLELAHG